MNKIALPAGIALGMTVLTLSCGGIRSIRMQDRHVEQQGDMLIVRGHWRLANGSPLHAVNNAVSLWCHKSQSLCVETRAELHLNHPQLGDYLMTAGPEWYSVVSWADGSMLASRETRVANVLLHVSVSSQTSEKTVTELGSQEGRRRASNATSLYILE